MVHWAVRSVQQTAGAIGWATGPTAIKFMEPFPACKVILFATKIGKASRCLKGYDFPLLKRPKYPANMVTFLATVDVMVMDRLPIVSVCNRRIEIPISKDMRKLLAPGQHPIGQRNR